MSAEPHDRDLTGQRLPLDEARAQLVVQAAKLFYQMELSQTEIAAELGLTRWQVAKLITEARETGVVRIQIVPRSQRLTELEVALQRRYGLREAVVVPGGDETLQAVAQAAGQYLAAVKPPLAEIGVSWGRTMAAVAAALPQGWAPGVHVVQVNGAVALRLTGEHIHAVAEDFARAAAGSATLLPAPAILGNARTREVLEQDRVVADVLALADRMQVMCFSLGALSAQSVHVASGYLTTDEIEALRARGAVGDILGRFVDAQGRIADADLDARTLGLPLHSLAGRDRVICVVEGAAKHAVTCAALRAGYVNVLITDEATAQAALLPHREREAPHGG